ncbi:MAG: hypothetical protein JXR42_02965 [Gammaproteobacteria bacterium]|nr:hypothetical protein [Gammaproteobacteria bacterium]
MVANGDVVRPHWFRFLLFAVDFTESSSSVDIMFDVFGRWKTMLGVFAVFLVCSTDYHAGGGNLHVVPQGEHVSERNEDYGVEMDELSDEPHPDGIDLGGDGPLEAAGQKDDSYIGNSLAAQPSAE